MKINFICPPASGNGGTETVLTKILNHYAQEHELTLTLTTKPENDNWLNSIDKNVNVKIPSHDDKLSKRLFFIKTFINTKNDENLVMLGANMIRVAATIRKVLHKKYRIVSWIHYSLFDQNMFDPKNILFADYHLAIASKIKEQLIQIGAPEEKIKLIYNPIERNHVRNTDQLTNEITYIGRTQFNGQKNLKELIDGLKKANDMHLSVIGTEKNDQIVKDYIAKEGLSERVTWYGWQKDPWALIENKTLAIVLTSKFEGLPMVFLEAISRGIPVISADFAGYDDVVKENINGLSYPQGNTDKLAEQINKIKELTSDPIKIANSISNFYSENYFNNLDKVFSEILIK